MQRSLNQFYGDGLIVGGGWCEKHQYLKPSIRNKTNFYTIDKNVNTAPDAVIDITNEAQCSIIPDNRFNLIYFECFPYGHEEYLLQAFKMAHRILKKDGVLIYHGGSAKSDSSIPEILNNAGFIYAMKKGLDPKSPKADRENGNISLASDTDFKLLQANFSSMPNAMKYYLSHYRFFSDEPYSPYPKQMFFSYSKPINVELSDTSNPITSLVNIEQPDSNKTKSTLIKNLLFYTKSETMTGLIRKPDKVKNGSMVLCESCKRDKS